MLTLMLEMDIAINKTKMKFLKDTIDNNIQDWIEKIMYHVQLVELCGSRLELFKPRDFGTFDFEGIYLIKP